MSSFEIFIWNTHDKLSNICIKPLNLCKKIKEEKDLDYITINNELQNSND